MGGVPPDDNSQGNDADGLLKFKQGLDGYRNFKGAGHPYQVNPGLRKVVAQLVDYIVYKSVAVDLVVF
jgi:hypothetical protein